jgi:hypothetical protein
LEHFIPCEREAELGRRSHNAGRAALEKCPKAFLFPDGLGGMSQAMVSLLAFSRLNLESSLNNIAWSREISGWHSCNGTGRKHLKHT